MKVDEYITLAQAETRRLRRATRWVLLLDALVMGVLGAMLWLTCTSFLGTTLADGVRKIVEWVGRK